MNHVLNQLLFYIKSNDQDKDENLLQLGLIIEKYFKKYSCEKSRIEDLKNYKILQKSEYFDILLNIDELKEILDFLLNLIDKSDPCIITIIWIFGKTYNSDYLNRVFKIILEKYPNNINVLRQLMFSIEGIELLKENLIYISEIRKKTKDNVLQKIIDKIISNHYKYFNEK